MGRIVRAAPAGGLRPAGAAGCYVEVAMEPARRHVRIAALSPAGGLYRRLYDLQFRDGGAGYCGAMMAVPFEQGRRRADRVLSARILFILWSG
jgi:hypothetical protein